MTSCAGTAVPEKQYTTSDVAVLFGVKPYRVRTWIRLGELRADKRNGYHYISESELKRFTEARYA